MKKGDSQMASGGLLATEVGRLQRLSALIAMLPARNHRDFEDIPEETRGKLEFVWLERVDDAVAQALMSS